MGAGGLEFRGTLGTYSAGFRALDVAGLNCHEHLDCKTYLQSPL